MRRILFLIMFPLTCVAADEAWNVSLYQGLYSKTNFGEILLSGKTHYEDSYITVAAVGKPTDVQMLGLRLETEGQVVRHSGFDKHIEFNGLVMARTPQIGSLPLTVGFAEGLSAAMRNPGIENPRKSYLDLGAESEYSRNLLNYLAVEMEVGLPVEEDYRPRAFVRLHHRSGIYGLLCPPTCGSNYIGYGVRVSY